MMTDKLDRDSLVYHYTTMGAFLALMETMELPHCEEYMQFITEYKLKFRGTLMPYMNDPDEYNFMAKCICKALKTYESNNQIQGIKSTWLAENLTLIDEEFGYPGLVSFSEVPDDLTMWRSYGGNGTGIALGFSKELLEKESSHRFIQCEYRTEEDATNYIYEHWAKELYDNLPTPNSQTKYNITLKYFVKIVSLRLRTKHSSYSLEREWRITQMLNDDRINFYERSGIIIPYTEILIPVDCLKEIVIGPCAKQELCTRSVVLLLANKLPPLLYKSELAKRLGDSSPLSHIKEKISIRNSKVPYVLL